jgi:hypothetical protein
MADDGLKIETAAGVTLRDAIRQHMTSFALTINTSRHTGQAVISAYIDGLSGAMALTIAGSHGSKEEIVNATLAKLREALDRDLQYLGKNHAKY